MKKHIINIVIVFTLSYIGQISAKEYALYVEAEPSDSQIKIMNITPKYQPGIKLKPGRYDILVAKENYQSKRQFVDISDKDVRVKITLVPNDELLWSETKDSEDYAKYKFYLDEYPNGKFAQEATQKLDDLTWLQISDSSDVTDYASYLEKFPKGNHREIAESKHESLLWAYTLELDTTNSYEAYLSKYPAGANAAIAQGKLEELLWVEISKENSLDGLTKYLEKFPKGKYAEQVVANMEKILWTIAIKEHTEAVYLEFIDLFPKSVYAAQAHEKIEQLMWENAQNFGNVEQYKSYLRRYPDGKYAAQVIHRLNVLKLTEIHHGEITMCISQIFIGVFRDMSCSGHFNGNATMTQLAANGWKFMGDISRADNFILVFQR